jgi:hypothetical protein
MISRRPQPPLQQQPRRFCDPQQQMAGATEFQPRVQLGSALTPGLPAAALPRNTPLPVH